MTRMVFTDADAREAATALRSLFYNIGTRTDIAETLIKGILGDVVGLKDATRDELVEYAGRYNLELPSRATKETISELLNGESS